MEKVATGLALAKAADAVAEVMEAETGPRQQTARAMPGLFMVVIPAGIIPLAGILQHHAMFGLVLIERVQAASPVRRNLRRAPCIQELLDQDRVVQFAHGAGGQPQCIDGLAEIIEVSLHEMA